MQFVDAGAGGVRAGARVGAGFGTGACVGAEPDGGITGRGDGKCTDFFQTRTDERLWWADTR